MSEVFHRGPKGRISGPDPDRPSYGSLATFDDPDGNVWLIQQVTQRLPGRVSGDRAMFSSEIDLATALRRAAIAHGEHEKRTGGARSAHGSHAAITPWEMLPFLQQNEIGTSEVLTTN